MYIPYSPKQITVIYNHSILHKFGIGWWKEEFFKLCIDSTYISLQGLTGYTINLLEELAKSMKFDYEIVIASENQYGYR